MKRAIILTLLLTVAAFAQKTEEERSWNQPVAPFKIAGNIYYVGASDVTSYLITTSKGHILIDSGFPETVPQIQSNVAKLGFKLTDVKFILNSHAHYDHAGGIAELKRLTGAKLLVSRPDENLFLNGGLKDPNFGDRFQFEAVKPDRLLKDREKVKLGSTTLTANLTAGHTPGCTSWTTTTRDNGRDLNVIFVCSTSSPGYKLVNNAGYPSIIDDYFKTFERLKSMKIDVFLGAHGGIYNLEEKVKLVGSSSNPFIDPQGYLDYLTASEAAFRKKLEEQRMAK
ncbi:MAG TPA: subclass B3 metallo-beta-lactamase [Pyrinomonadaceae bacterium]|nr:subclass B3 metallo-beta-lactamase [Pyrinomonadaceae bacterium]